MGFVRFEFILLVRSSGKVFVFISLSRVGGIVGIFVIVGSNWVIVF